ncbi:MAG: hypothetical protein AAGL10_09390 [Pseudomonadota bacterium]
MGNEPMSPVVMGVLGTLFLGICYGTWRNPRLWSALFWSFVATFMLTAALSVSFPAPFKDKVFALTIIMPLVWVGFQFWLYWNPGRWTVTLILFVITILSTATVLLIPTPV